MYSKRMIIRIALMVLTVSVPILFLIGCTGTNMLLTEKNNGDSINLKLNDVATIKLESNPTTGYSWFLKDPSDESTVSVTGPEFTESKNDKELVGSGGYETFSIRAISKGKTEIIIYYQRPWEKELKPEKTFKITFSVE